jgi:hypothetical protein
MMEKVRGRFSGFVSVGEETLRLPDFDEALFPVPGLLNFSVTVAGKRGKEALIVETQMLTSAESTDLVERALESIPSIKILRVSVRCQHNPNEAGSLLKRVIQDKRGQVA